MIRALIFVLLLLLAITTPREVFFFAMLVALLIEPAPELLIIGVIIDGVFGTASHHFFYTVLIGLLMLGVESIRPYLSWYTKEV